METAPDCGWKAGTEHVFRLLAMCCTRKQRAYTKMSARGPLNRVTASHLLHVKGGYVAKKMGPWCHHRKKFKDTPSKLSKQSRASRGFIKRKEESPLPN